MFSDSKFDFNKLCNYKSSLISMAISLKSDMSVLNILFKKTFLDFRILGRLNKILLIVVNNFIIFVIFRLKLVKNLKMLIVLYDIETNPSSYLYHIFSLQMSKSTYLNSETWTAWRP